MSLSLAPFARYYQLFTKNKEGLYHARFGVVVSWLLVNVYHNQMINQSCAGAKHHSDVNEVVHGKLVLPFQVGQGTLKYGHTRTCDVEISSL